MNKQVKKVVVAAGSALALVAGSAHAALPTGVDTTITGSGADVQTALGLMITVAVGIWATKKVLHLFGR